MANKYSVSIQYDKNYGIAINDVKLSFKLFNYYYIFANSLTIINMSNVSFINKMKMSDVTYTDGYIYEEPVNDEAFR